ncbi:hypothetical protein KBD08_00315 [Candidatus Babeliales bacterium]|nr:hypothetical protein [Candidatus Babeliales bacterium]
MFIKKIQIIYCIIVLLTPYQVHTAIPSTNKTHKKEPFSLNHYKELEEVAHAKYARSPIDVRQTRSNDYYTLAASFELNMQKLIIEHHHKKLIAMEYDPEQHHSMIRRLPYIISDLRSCTYLSSIVSQEIYDDIRSIQHILETKQRIFNAYIICKTSHNNTLPYIAAQSPTTPHTPVPFTQIVEDEADPELTAKYIAKSVFLFFNDIIFIPFKSSTPYDHRLEINPSAVTDTYRINQEELCKNLTIALEDAYQQPRTSNLILTIRSITHCVIQLRQKLAKHHAQLALDTQELLNQTDQSSKQLYARTSIALQYHKAQETMHNRCVKELQNDLDIFTLDL